MLKNKVVGRTIYSHVTCATDTQNINVVFTSVRDIIASKAMVNINL